MTPHEQPVATPRPPVGRARTGWWILLVMAALLIVNGAWLATNLVAADTFEQDTGSSLASVQADHPGVLEAYERQGTSLGILVAGLGLVAGVAAFMGLRTGERSAWAASFALFLAVAGLAAGIVVAGGRIDVASVWIGYAVVLLVGLLLSAGRARAA